MSAKIKSNKRSPRQKPCKARGVNSRGTARMSKHPLDEIAKVQLGKGLFASFRPIGAVRH